MTKQLHKLARELQSRLLSGGGASGGMEPVLRDGWATLYRWHQAGERVWRIDDEETPTLPAGLVLATAHVHAAALCYTGPERGDWIAVARHAAAEPIVIHGEHAYAFPEPMITYLTDTEAGGISAGCLNLEEQPTWDDVYLPAGKSGERWLGQDEIAREETRLHRAMAHWFRPPAIVV